MSAPTPDIEPEIIIRKVAAKGHGAAHGGAWKVAYADFVTAMMAFFLLMWLIGATNEDQRKGIADYFAPTVMQSTKSGGSNGVLGGRSILEPDGIAAHERRTGPAPVAPFQTADANGAEHGQANPTTPDPDLRRVESAIRERIRRDSGLNSLQGQVRFVQTREGLRIELIDKADYSMFTNGTADMDARAAKLLAVVADVIAPLPNKISVRGHTDSRPYSNPATGANNWTLSLDRAEITRRVLARAGIPNARFSRLEGVADTQPLYPQDALDPRNRRMSVTLLRG